MKNYPITLLLAGLAGLVLLAACEGFFPTGDFEPTGTPFYPATGITVEAVTGKDAGFPSTGVYPLSVVLRSSGGTLTDVLPAGLLFRSLQNRVQHMLVLKPHAVTASDGGTANEIGVFCCNELRHIPRSGDSFELGPVTNNPGLQEIASLVRDKDISAALWTVQRAVWMVTDSTGLNGFYRDSLAALPDETDGPVAGRRYDRRELEREKLLWRELRGRDR